MLITWISQSLFYSYLFYIIVDGFGGKDGNPEGEGSLPSWGQMLLHRNVRVNHC